MVTHRIVKMTKALNFMRSANAPVIRAGVMMANMAWKIMNAWSGMFSPSSALTPLRPNNLRFPTKPPMSLPKARLYPHSTQTTPTMPMVMKLYIIVDRTFF